MRKTLLNVAVIASLVSACSDLYYDRRETIALGADDHIASDMALQMIDPWPRYVGNKNIAFNGERMQTTIECYRRNPRIYQPVSPTTTGIMQQQALQAAGGTTCPPLQQSTPLAAPAAAPVK